MIHVGWLVGVILGSLALNAVITRLLVREIQALSRALIAKNPKELALLDRAMYPQKRTVPEREADFTDRKPRALGLR